MPTMPQEPPFGFGPLPVREAPETFVCEDCGANADDYCRVTQGGPFDEYSDECTACGKFGFNRSVFVKVPRG